MTRSKRSHRDLSEERGCLPKIAWDSWADAELAACLTIDQDQEAGKPLRHTLLAYRCPYCGSWHIGHSYGPWPDEGRPIERRFKSSPRLLAQRTRLNV